MNDKGLIIGIDLGTTNSEAAIIKQNQTKPETIKNLATGDDIIPSIVGIDPKSKKIIVGKEAKHGLENDPDNFIKEVKSKMGSKEKLSLGNENLLPEEIAALILKEIKKYSEEALGEELERAVITVPANFDDSQRKATKRAGEIAGFKVERIINEPTAAALAYGIDNKENKRILVYDLGGGTFDVTILEYDSEVLDVKTSDGDNKLGGKDFDEILYDYVESKFFDEYGIKLAEENKINYRVLYECEELKKRLSNSENSILGIPNVTIKDGKAINILMEFTRSKFESLVKEKIDETEELIYSAMKQAKLKKEDIDEVLLVGGSTRIPYVRKLVERVMGKTPRRDVDPDIVVALGAAIQGNIIDGKTDTIIMDRVPFSLGTEVVTGMGGKLVTGVYDEILPAQYPFLKESTKQFKTLIDNQEMVNVKVYQKKAEVNSMWAKDHIFLGEDELTGIPANEAGQETITVTFTYNLNGILDVNAVIDSTGKMINFQVEAQHIDIEDSKKHIDELWRKSEKAEKDKATILAAEDLLKKIGKHEKLEGLINELKKAVIKGNDELIEQLDDELTDLVFDIQEE